ncbi:quinoprotein glucose dehydrogenase [Bacillus mangrovi]|uniref:Quinoprotein glucose dehydrogenase n=1 Tax=Metabacillus mangrovi TaxID=1491830 RepID=A0A7X2S162_9BACI|nr:PQQ-dependent sugar dehydrogenase [Metabacillus mangrovi]MTH51947.1 quinoprotein glucose dehydrogenase [Metabacillus mangrovi]
MRKAVFLLLITLTACSGSRETSESLTAEALAENLDTPWSISAAGDTIYLTERPGAIVKIEDGKQIRMDVRLKHPLSKAAEAGLLGMELHPDFDENREAFAYYTYDDEGTSSNKLIKLKLQGGTWSETETLLDRIPSGPFHQGGRMKIGPDQKLYVTAGDAAEESKAQDPEDIGGKILRLELDGSVPEDNPDPDSPVYSLGHRNPQGMAWDNAGSLFSTEHGPDGKDEINRITPGANYGWPKISGDQKGEGFLPPLLHSGDESWAPSGAALKGDILYFAGLRGEAVFAYDLKAEKLSKIAEGYGRIRDVYSRDNDLYFITNNTDGRGTANKGDDKLYKLQRDI